MRVVFSYCFILFFCGSVHSETTKPIVILLSIDGFAYKYLHKYQPKNIIALSKSGVVAKLQSVYPSKTFPNHLSIITGTYPINHGITNNAFYSPELGKHYTLGAGKNNATWLKADPLWHVAEQQGVKTAVYFWPESEALGKQPSYNIAYNKKDSNKDRLDQIFAWLMLPIEQQPQLIVSYFSSVDSAGHTYGPNSQEVMQAIEELDLLLGKFVAKLATEVTNEINLIIVSDHGMIQKDNDKVITPSMVFNTSILDLIATEAITIASNDTQLYLYFTPSKPYQLDREKITQQLIEASIKNQNKNLYRLYTKGSYPKHWQLNSSSALVPDMIFEALPPATFVKENYDFTTLSKGTHGYDPIGTGPTTQKELLGIFIATGPDFIKERTQENTIPTAENIHVFPAISSILGIEIPNTIDGKKDILLPNLKNKIK